MSGLIDYNHYVLKERITQAIVLGHAVTAVCGEVFTPSARPGGGGSVSEAAWEVCPLCEVIYDAMPDGVGAEEQKRREFPNVTDVGSHFPPADSRIDVPHELEY